MIITAEDFNLVPYKLPDAVVVLPSGVLEANVDLALYIDDKEATILSKLFGVLLYKAFVDGLVNLPDAYVVPLGAGYSIDDLVLYNNKIYKSIVDTNLLLPTDILGWLEIPNRWLLLRDGDTYVIAGRTYEWIGIKKMLVPYIYALWLRDNFDDHTRLGVVVRNAENATVISPARRIVKAYNSFSLIAGHYYHQYNTLYGYLYQRNVVDNAFSDVYDNQIYSTFGAYLNDNFRSPGTMNTFNI